MLFVSGINSSKHSTVLGKLLLEIDQQHTMLEAAEDPTTVKKLTLSHQQSQSHRRYHQLLLQNKRPINIKRPSNNSPSSPEQSPTPCSFSGGNHWHRDGPFARSITSRSICSTCNGTGHKTDFCESARKRNEITERKMTSRPTTPVQQVAQPAQILTRPHGEHLLDQQQSLDNTSPSTSGTSPAATSSSSSLSIKNFPVAPVLRASAAGNNPRIRTEQSRSRSITVAILALIARQLRS